MTDLERIKFIEETFGFELKQVAPEKIGEKNFYVASPFWTEGSRSYCLDDNNNITGLALDFENQSSQMASKVKKWAEQLKKEFAD